MIFELIVIIAGLALNYVFGNCIISERKNVDRNNNVEVTRAVETTESVVTGEENVIIEDIVAVQRPRIYNDIGSSLRLILSANVAAKLNNDNNACLGKLTFRTYVYYIDEMALLVITGTLPQISDCVRRISAFLYRDYPLGIVSVNLLLQHRHMGAMIGRAGSTVKRLAKDTNTRIRSRRELFNGSTERRVTITGQPDGVMEAVFRIYVTVIRNSSDSNIRSLRYWHPSNGL